MKTARNVLIFISFLAVLILSCQTLTTSTSTLTGKDLYIKLRNDALATKPQALNIILNLNGNCSLWCSNG